MTKTTLSSKASKQYADSLARLLGGESRVILSRASHGEAVDSTLLRHAATTALFAARIVDRTEAMALASKAMVLIKHADDDIEQHIKDLSAQMKAIEQDLSAQLKAIEQERESETRKAAALDDSITSTEECILLAREYRCQQKLHPTSAQEAIIMTESTRPVSTLSSTGRTYASNLAALLLDAKPGTTAAGTSAAAILNQAKRKSAQVDSLNLRQAATTALSHAATAPGLTELERQVIARKARHLIYHADATIKGHVDALPVFFRGERSRVVKETALALEQAKDELDKAVQELAEEKAARLTAQERAADLSEALDTQRSDAAREAKQFDEVASFLRERLDAAEKVIKVDGRDLSAHRTLLTHLVEVGVVNPDIASGFISGVKAALR